MTKICVVTQKKTLFGQSRSNSMKSTKRKFFPNLHKRRIWLSKEKKFIRLKISCKAMKIIDKNGGFNKKLIFTK